MDTEAPTATDELPARSVSPFPSDLFVAPGDRFVLEPPDGCLLSPVRDAKPDEYRELRYRCKTPSLTLEVGCFETNPDENIEARIASFSTPDSMLVPSRVSQHWPEDALYFEDTRRDVATHIKGWSFAHEDESCYLLASFSSDAVRTPAVSRTIASFTSGRAALDGKDALPPISEGSPDSSALEAWLLATPLADGALRFESRKPVAQEEDRSRYGAGSRTLRVDHSGGGTLTIIELRDEFEQFYAFQQGRAIPEYNALVNAGYAFEYWHPADIGEYAEGDAVHSDVGPHGMSAGVSFVRCGTFVALSTFSQAGSQQKAVSRAAKEIDAYMVDTLCQKSRPDL